MIKIGIDIAGGDFAPKAIVEGIAQSLPFLAGDARLILIGNSDEARTILSSLKIEHNQVDFVHTNEIIEMDDHPVKAFSGKKDSSIVRGFELLKTKQIDAFASAGNTGAMMAGVMMVIKPVQGVLRPCLAVQIPRINAKPGIILDVGLNPDTKPDVLFQYGELGSLYAQYVLGIKNPKIGLLNIGGEETKGNLAAKQAHQLMKHTSKFNFTGNIEGNEIFDTSKSDVIVCDGFAGNIVLKQAEAFYELYKERKLKDDFFDGFNFENFGGTPILGINANVIIAHGHSTPTAIKNMILQTRQIVSANLPDKITEHFTK